MSVTEIKLANYSLFLDMLTMLFAMVQKGRLVVSPPGVPLWHLFE